MSYNQQKFDSFASKNVACDGLRGNKASVLIILWKGASDLVLYLRYVCAEESRDYRKFFQNFRNSFAEQLITKKLKMFEYNYLQNA